MKMIFHMRIILIIPYVKWKFHMWIFLKYMFRTRRFHTCSFESVHLTWIRNFTSENVQISYVKWKFHEWKCSISIWLSHWKWLEISVRFVRNGKSRVHYSTQMEGGRTYGDLAITICSEMLLQKTRCFTHVQSYAALTRKVANLE